MKKPILLAAILFAAINCCYTQTKVNPVIKSFGAVYKIPDAAHKPDAKLVYNILVELTENAEKPDTLNEYLEAVATLINLHAAEGVPKENIHVVVVLRKMATYAVVGDEMYKEKFKVDNPNHQLIKELDEAGVEFYVCGQTMKKRNIDKTRLVPQAKIASSGLTAITTYQLQGYALIKF